MYPLFSTTTCSFTNPWITRDIVIGDGSGQRLPTGNNQNFNFGSSTCVTINSVQSGGFVSSSTVPVLEGIFALGPIFLFFLVVIFWVWMYKIFRR